MFLERDRKAGGERGEIEREGGRETERSVILSILIYELFH